MYVIAQLKQLSPERFLSIYQSLELQGYGPLDAEVAKSLRFRPQAVTKLPMAQRAKRAKQILEQSKSTELCYEIFGAYLIKTQRALVTDFLDKTGVPHENGMIEDVTVAKPDAAKLDTAIAELDAAHPKEDVTLYLALCAEQWPEVEALGAAWKSRTS